MRRELTPTDPQGVREEGLEALQALGNEQRISILQTLAQADGPLSFSTLRERVGIDDTGRFNYHLTQLCGQFVREVEGGYKLGHAGQRVVVAAADLDPDAAAMAGEQRSETQCPVCGDHDCDKLIHVHLSSN